MPKPRIIPLFLLLLGGICVWLFLWIDHTFPVANPLPLELSSPASIASERSVTSTSATVTTRSIPILMYHYIEVPRPNDPHLGLFITPETFDRQLTWLQDHGYTAVDFRTMERMFAGEISGPPKPVILTFDDGWTDTATTVVPLLASHRMIGVFYIISDFLGRAGFVSERQVRAMAESGMVIGSHSTLHEDLTIASEHRVMWELSKSKRELERILGRPVTDFAYPSGRYNAASEDLARAAGYETAVTTHTGIVTTETDRFALPRMRMTGATNLAKVLGENT